MATADLTPPPPAKRVAMQKQKVEDTKPELALRRELHRRGLRYRLHQRPVPELRRTADILFTRARVAVLVHGCFWHGCPEHGTQPKANSDWWAQKLERNIQRDEETRSAFEQEGWSVVTVWEHEDPDAGAKRVEDAVRRRHSNRL